MTRESRLLMIVPFVLLAMLTVIAVTIGQIIGVWVWVPICIVYWSSMAFLSLRIAGIDGVKNMFGASKGNTLWPILTIAMALALIPMQLLPNIQVFAKFWVVILTIIVAICNSFIEEIFWRGMYIDFVNGIPVWIRISYSALLFSSIHLPLAVTSIASRYPPLYVSLFALGILWGNTYHKTKSLRWPVITHFMIDIFTLCVPVFMNIYIPPGMG
jgi:uncharacterized protein